MMMLKIPLSIQISVKEEGVTDHISIVSWGWQGGRGLKLTGTLRNVIKFMKIHLFMPSSLQKLQYNGRHQLPAKKNYVNQSLQQGCAKKMITTGKT